MPVCYDVSIVLPHCNSSNEGVTMYVLWINMEIPELSLLPFLIFSFVFLFFVFFVFFFWFVCFVFS